MSALPVETMEPNPASTSLPNDATTETKVETKEVTEDNANPITSGNDDSPKKSSALRTYENGVLKTSAHQHEGKNNSKYDPSVLPVTDDPKQIRSQVEFYFGDTNLPTDNFMWELTGGAENRPIPVTKICEFGRMKRFQPRSAVVTALKASNFLEVSGAEGDEQIKRKNPFDPTIPKSKVEARSVYVKGFGDEEPSSQFDIEAFFAPYGPTNAVRLRRTDDKLFKGSVFVEFQDEEIAKKFLEMDPKPVWKGCHPLEIKSKTQYIETKAQEIRDGKVDPKAHRGNRGGRGGNHRGSNRGRGDNRDRTDRNRGDRDPDDWKKRREDDRASGFKDDRKNGRNDRRGNNRGGRGRRDDRGPRNNDRNRERDEKNKNSTVNGKDTEKENNKTAGDEVANGGEVKVDSQKNDKKRTREDDDGEQAPAKKVDTKSEVTAAS